MLAGGRIRTAASFREIRFNLHDALTCVEAALPAALRGLPAKTAGVLVGHQGENRNTGEKEEEDLERQGAFLWGGGRE